MVEHQRYLRLQHLLERSTIYSKFMLKQMVEQREKEKKEDEKNARHKKIVTNPDSEEKVCIRCLSLFLSISLSLSLSLSMSQYQSSVVNIALSPLISDKMYNIIMYIVPRVYKL